jgi:hypothetical protein
VASSAFLPPLDRLVALVSLLRVTEQRPPCRIEHLIDPRARPTPGHLNDMPTLFAHSNRMGYTRAGRRLADDSTL